MNEEVKELIVALKATSESQPKELENYMVENLITFNGDKCKVLLDYINQLERKNEIFEATQYCPYDKDCGKLYDCTTEEYLSMCDANVDLMAKIDQLETNWNKLKECLLNEYKFVPHHWCRIYKSILNAMEELERGKE